MSIPATKKLLLTAQEVSELISIHVDDIYRMGAAGELPRIMIGRRSRYPLKGILAWIDQSTGGTSTSDG